MIVPSSSALKTIRHKQPFVLSRSTSHGSDSHATHWTGDNRATFEDMYFSIPSAYEQCTDERKRSEYLLEKEYSYIIKQRCYQKL
jgi:hypothetical protein